MIALKIILTIVLLFLIGVSTYYVVDIWKFYSPQDVLSDKNKVTKTSTGAKNIYTSSGKITD